MSTGKTESAVRLKDSYKARLMGKKTLIYVVCIFLCALSLFPFLVMFVNATRPSAEIAQRLSIIPGNMLITNWNTLQERQNFDFVRGMLNSLLVSTSSTALCLYVSLMTSYGLVVYKFRGNRAAFTFIMVVLMIPSQVSIIGFFNEMYRMNLINTYWPLILPAAASPTVVFFLRQYMLGALPMEIVEAARIDGSGEFRTFNRIALPMMAPAIATQAIFTFVGSWNNLFTPSMIINSQNKFTMPLLVSLLKSDRFRTDFGTVYLALSLTVLPLFVVYFALSKFIIGGVALGGVKE